MYLNVTLHLMALPLANKLPLLYVKVGLHNTILFLNVATLSMAVLLADKISLAYGRVGTYLWMSCC